MQHVVFTVTTKRYSKNDFRLTSEHNQQFTDLLRERENEERENTRDKHARRLAVLGNANGQIAKTQQFSLTSLAFSIFFSQSAMTFSRDKYYKSNFNFWEINPRHTKDNLTASRKLLAWSVIVNGLVPGLQSSPSMSPSLDSGSSALLVTYSSRSLSKSASSCCKKKEKKESIRK